MRQILVFVNAILTAFCVSTGAWAQSPKAVDAALSVFQSQDEALEVIGGNLSAMIVNVNEIEYGKIDLFLDQIANVSGQSMKLSAVSGIYTVMVDQRDIDSVKRFLSISCYYFNRSTDRAITTANQILPKLSTIALIQEVTKGRDLLAQLGQTQLCKIAPEFKK